jgi:nucleotide-binding universal stress UspA family protein
MNVPAEREHQIVVGVDCTPRSSGLLRWADRQARLTGSRLIAVTGWRIELLGLDPADTMVDVQARTRQLLAETIRAALPPERARAVQLRVVDIAPADALVVESMTADLVVVGPHSAHAIEGLLLGSVTEHVLSEASCPVAVVHDTTLDQKHRIVVGLDGSDCSRRALAWAIRQATLTDATVDAILAWEWTPMYGVYPFGPDDATVEKAARQLLDSELGRLPTAISATVHGRLVRGHPARVLLDASAGSDALVVGNHRAGITASRMLGSISQKVARHATVPVIVVHEHDHSTPAATTRVDGA